MYLDRTSTSVGEAVVFEENKTVAKGLVTYMILDGRVGA